MYVLILYAVKLKVMETMICLRDVLSNQVLLSQWNPET